MRALVLNCTLKPSPARSNTDQLADVVIDGLQREKIETERLRLVDLAIKPIGSPESLSPATRTVPIT